MAFQLNAIPVFEWVPASPAFIVGGLVTGLTVTITVWKLTDAGVEQLALTADTCAESGTTGKYAWSTANIPAGKVDRSRTQYHFLMSDGGVNNDEGDFILELVEGDGHVPSDSSEYLVSTT